MGSFLSLLFLFSIIIIIAIVDEIALILILGAAPIFLLIVVIPFQSLLLLLILLVLAGTSIESGWLHRRVAALSVLSEHGRSGTDVSEVLFGLLTGQKLRIGSLFHWLS